MFLAFLICARGILFEKGKDIFLFGLLPVKFLGSVAGRNADEAKRNYFCGRKRICFAWALFQNDGNFVSAAQEDAGGMRGGFLAGGG
ncbi:MAG TPA: hypothetical protein DEF00_02895 [Candidatus Taylorbacteria bacterium]|uniref:Uncharacterized protein n=1 Tax=Candidatus Kaiserbacteria bacterium GW2011_GWA2_49_56 TaxID=1618670 RepID=A0A0G1VSD7_9BACT|nr:MAG: hypothetical protein UY29_C0011G0014 [Parcubacteria group bacterium GW2011_GWC2_48_17]KKW09433.1 MAG: hypothetical protein UY46_C0001G0013 [Candidatus Kaiserbacteria bacterium GW2011_GWA2_49_56]HBV01313.1 hypothetical protein [Candidatus Taylorbacteria bacterium]